MLEKINMNSKNIDTEPKIISAVIDFVLFSTFSINSLLLYSFGLRFKKPKKKER